MATLTAGFIVVALIALLAAVVVLGYIFATAPSPPDTAVVSAPLVLVPPQAQPAVPCAVNSVSDACTALLSAASGAPPSVSALRNCVTAWSAVGPGTPLACAAPCDAVFAALATTAPALFPPSPDQKNAACALARTLRGGVPSRSAGANISPALWSITAFVNAAATCVASTYQCG